MEPFYKSIFLKQTFEQSEENENEKSSYNNKKSFKNQYCMKLNYDMNKIQSNTVNSVYFFRKLFKLNVYQ